MGIFHATASSTVSGPKKKILTSVEATNEDEAARCDIRIEQVRYIRVQKAFHPYPKRQIKR
ncbi:hypothetical protein EGR_04110 [Echinococcus granulosus]|uniref:Uncharacterized protein n=1 Tax=Echinococcus granulosus TaxID=6210 RepID=W6URW3_ECHGR|nr:hypothetical protein EGR_04110 [Echinococcus granulosus]EUB61077.1 hypothetical protein EGR_04110 [Echinococcus granulosus]